MKRHLKRLKFILDDPNKKSFIIIIKEFLQLWVLKREIPLHYFGRYFYRRDAPKNYHDYLSVQQYNRINKAMEYFNKQYPTIFSILDNKLFWDLFCKSNKLPSPFTLGFNFKNRFYYNDEQLEIKDATQLVHFFKNILNKEELHKIFIKPIQGHGGLGAIVLDKSTINEQCDLIFSKISNDSYIFQKVVQQHELISQIYSKSINTIRFETFIDKNRDIHLLGCFIRIGSGNSIVDNLSSGGFFIPIHRDSGKLFNVAKAGLITGAKINTKHPDSGFVYDGFVIPYYKEALNLAFHAASLLSSYIQGWDVAITNNGPILIEGNNTPGLLYSEFGYNGYKNNPLMQEILSDTEHYYKTKR